jgi:hypothetical protein
MNKKIIVGSLALSLHFFCHGQAEWSGNYLIVQSYPKRMPDEVRKDIWSKLEISEGNSKLTWKYSSKQFLHFCATSGYATGTDDSLALFFERYDSCGYHGKTFPGLMTPFLILKRENEKYFICEAQEKGNTYSSVVKQKIE